MTNTHFVGKHWQQQNKNTSSRIRSARLTSGLVRMSSLISLNPLLFENIAYVRSFKSFVFNWKVCRKPIYINTFFLELLVPE